MKYQVDASRDKYGLFAEFITIRDNETSKWDMIIMTSELVSTCISIAESILKNNSIEHFAVLELKTGKIVWSTYPDNGVFEKGAWISNIRRVKE